MNNIEYFKKQVKYWSKKFKLGDINVYPDPNMWFTAFVGLNKGVKHIKYNSNILRGLPKSEVLRIVFHELGHFKHPYFNANHKYKYWEHLSCEYMAEKQMFKWIKKYYPRYYKIASNDCADLINDILSLPKKYRFYFEAFSQIPEYAEVLNKENENGYL